MTVKLGRFLLRVPVVIDVQLDAADGKTALQLVNRSIADGGLDRMQIRIKPLRGKSFAGGRIVKTEAKPAKILKSPDT